ncbi:hypothetical protein BOX15_Mlig007901g2 [Macrostomum lignano]|uniref:Tyrosine-protein kinase n=1 Tax=Macrostomum lignano TaxID=282301 RepID=A0A267GBG8_9PLAT|nr:hypothetical protein BOX15_Mlig007901g2 [Macrostomum lignano]
MGNRHSKSSTKKPKNRKKRKSEGQQIPTSQSVPNLSTVEEPSRSEPAVRNSGSQDDLLHNGSVHVQQPHLPPPRPPPKMPEKSRKQMKALFDFEKQTDGDLSFKKDDIFDLVDDSDQFWWKMTHTGTGETGYVPYNYVQQYDGGPTSLSCWFDLDRREAERNLLMPGLQEGTFLLRPCRQRADQALYTLSIRTEENTRNMGRQILVKHYMVRPLDSGGLYISPKITFPTVKELLEHYEHTQDGLCCKLSKPCPRKYEPPPQFRDLELNRNQLQLVEKIGKGSFGEVWKAKLGRLVEVAVKMMHSDGQGIAMNKGEFIREAQTMHQLHHPKIVQLLGVCTTEEPFYIVTELMPNGALLSYLKNDEKNGRKITYRAMLDMLFQIADGMAYLEEKKFIHRDLRAANILVGHENVVKVGDFGLSRLIEEDVYDVGENTKFPIRWTAPEAATDKVFTNKSDVWSFGVLIYEVVTRGRVPYQELQNKAILSLVSNGHRMPNPHNEQQGIRCDEFLYKNIMLACWHSSEQERPTFATLRNIFESYETEAERQYE